MTPNKNVDYTARYFVYTDRKDKDLKNFWNHVVFHPTDAMEDDWGMAVLERIYKDKAAKTIRIYSMFEEMVTLDENGQMQYDFTNTDFRLDYLVSRGFDILLSYGFVPGFLTEDETVFKPRYKDKKLFMSRVVDYARWEEICRVYTQHLVDRYGEDTVSKWHLNCYNEPNSNHFFYGDCPDIETKIEEYCKLYDGFEAGITAVSRKIPIGGPALAGSAYNFKFLAGLLDHIKKTGRKIDFVNFHRYGTSPKMIRLNETPFKINYCMDAVQNVKHLVKCCGFEDLAIIWGEWGATSEGYKTIKDVPQYAFRDNEAFAAYFVKLLTFWDDQGAPFDKMIFCLSGQDRNEADYLGYRNFFTKNGYAKPIYNAFVLSARLGQEKLNYFAPIRTLATGRTSVMPTKHEDGHISILMAYADDDMIRDLESSETTVEVMGLDKTYRVSKYVIDAEHANGIFKYRQLGCPDAPDDAQKKAIREFSELKEENAGFVSAQNNAITFEMCNNSVILLELYPES